MNFPDSLLPAPLVWAAHFLLAVILVFVLKSTPWRQLRETWALNLWLGACVSLMLLWQIKTGIKPGLDFHLLGATGLTLMFGPRLALLALAIVVAATTIAGQAGWQAYSLNVLVMGALPVGVSYALFRLADTRLTNHLFVYIFVNGFFGAAIAIAVTGLAASLLLSASGVYTFHYLRSEYLPYYILMGWSEALTTGMLITIMVIFRPQWISTFDDTRYLNK